MTDTPRRRSRAATDALTPADIDALASALADGRRATVYLREPMPSLGLEAGVSARVISIDGTTLLVRPKGVDDQLPFEADELRATRPRPAPEASAAPTRTPRAARPSTPPAPVTPTPVTPAPVSSVPVSSAPAVATTPAPAPATAAPAPRTVRRPRSGGSSVTISVTGSEASSWTVTVSVGTKRVGKPVETTPDRVARAVRELGDEAAIAAVDEVIESARADAQRRIEELAAELDRAREKLARLEGR